MSGRRGLVVPQNTFLDNIIKKTNGTRKLNKCTLLLLCIICPRHKCTTIF